MSLSPVPNPHARTLLSAPRELGDGAAGASAGRAQSRAGRIPAEGLAWGPSCHQSRAAGVLVMVTGHPICAPGTDPVIWAWGGLGVTPDAKQHCMQAQGRRPPCDRVGLTFRLGAQTLMCGWACGSLCPASPGPWVFSRLQVPYLRCHLAESTSPPSGPQDVAGPSASPHVDLSVSALCFSLFLELFHKTMPAAGGHQHEIQHCQARFWEPVKEEWVSFLASRCSGSVFGPVTSLVSDIGLRIKTCSPSLILGPPPSLSQRAPVTLAVLPDALGRCTALPLPLHHLNRV